MMMKEKKREHGGGLELQLATGEKSTFLIPAATGKEKDSVKSPRAVVQRWYLC
jgi:hypothetical protein